MTEKKAFGFKSISDGAIDTTTASGELIFNIFSALAQFEWRGNVPLIEHDRLLSRKLWPKIVSAISEFTT